MDWETHLQRLETPEGYRPPQCDHCGGTRLHGHGLRLRALAGDELRVIEIRRYRCAGCRAVWQVLPGFVARRLWRRWEVVDGALTGKRRRGRAPVPERTKRRSCERFNQYLDRALVVPTLGNDPSLAFFSTPPIR